MARFRPSKQLYCFYCGKRAGLTFDGVKRSFVCRNCDATNYLDANGDITDPPVATEHEASTQRFAAPRPPPAQVDGIFCATCLKNQHLFTMSLAQYLPDDPSDPDFARLERNYHRYRRGLEKRYPQVCEGCADKVEARIRQAGYTAKTDHLRRMMDLSRGRKRSTATRSAVDAVHGAGRVVWRGGFVMQLLWHVSSCARLLEQADDSSEALGIWSGRVAAVLPEPDSLIYLSIVAAVASAWWNPHFVQLHRGFTRHLLGFAQWYLFQVLIIACRVLFRGMVAMEGGHVRSVPAQLSAHAVMAGLMLLIFVLSGRSIRVDMSPLFGPNSQPLATNGAASSPVTHKDEATKTLSEILNDALETPSKVAPSPDAEQDYYKQPLSIHGSAATAVTPLRQYSRDPLSLTGSLSRALDTPKGTPFRVQDVDEMDWSPIAPQHRAFAPQASPSKSRGGPLSESAGNMMHNPFRFQVPAAPVGPARRLRNPPQPPEVRDESQPEPCNVMFGRGGAQNKERNEANNSGVEFRQPRFFAPERDDASSLADLLGQSFSLSQENGEMTDGGDDAGAGLMGWSGQGRKTGQGNGNGLDKTRVAVDGSVLSFSLWESRLAQPLLLVILLLTWTSTLIPAMDPWRVEIQLSVMALSGLLALGTAGDAGGGSPEKRGSSSSSSSSSSRIVASILAAWTAAELASICWIAMTLRNKGTFADVDRHGLGVLAAMLARVTFRSAAA